MKGCKGCKWNCGVERIKNRFGCMESKRVCGYYGYLDAWITNRSVCRVKEAKYER